MPLIIIIDPVAYYASSVNKMNKKQTDHTTRCVSQNLVNCGTTVGTTCTTNPQQIEVMELESYSRPTCNKLRASSHDTLPIIGVIHKLDRR